MFSTVIKRQTKRKKKVEEDLKFLKNASHLNKVEETSLFLQLWKS
jgi:hypothetical protein